MLCCILLFIPLISFFFRVYQKEILIFYICRCGLCFSLAALKCGKRICQPLHSILVRFYTKMDSNKAFFALLSEAQWRKKGRTRKKVVQNYWVNEKPTHILSPHNEMCTWNDELVKVNTGKNLPTLFSFLPIRYGEWVYVFSLMSQCVKEREKKNYIKIYLLLCAAVRFAFVLRQRKNPGSYSPFSFATSFRCCCCCRCSILTHMHRNTQIQMEYCSRSSHNPPVHSSYYPVGPELLALILYYFRLYLFSFVFLPFFSLLSASDFRNIC